MQKYSKLVQFSGNRHSMSVLSVSVCQTAAKKALFSSHTPARWSHGSKWNPVMMKPLEPPLLAKVWFVRIDPADWKLPGDNQSMPNSVFSVSSYILVLRSRCHSKGCFSFPKIKNLNDHISKSLLAPREILPITGQNVSCLVFLPLHVVLQVLMQQ